MDSNRTNNKNIGMGTGSAAAIIAIWLFAFIGSALANTNDLQLHYQFKIPPERLDSALIAFSAETHIHLVTSVLPADVLSPGVSGDLSTANALTALLGGTGMSFREVDSGTVVVLPAHMAQLRPAQFQLVSDLMDPDVLADQPTAGAAPAAAQPGTGLTEVQVTGTRIVREGYEAPTPVTAVGLQQLQDVPLNNIGESLNELPEFQGSVLSQNQTFSDQESAQTELNLRNLSADRTLILFDGRRLPTANTENVPDLDLIPDALVQRVDVVTGGASSVYGSDAVAGVVNYVLDTNFTGFKGSLQGGISGYDDGPSEKISLTFGTTFFDGRLHLELSGDQKYQHEMLGLPRPWDTSGQSLIQNPAFVTNKSVPEYIHEPCCTGVAGDTAGGTILSGPLQGTTFGVGGEPDSYNYGFGLTAAGDGDYGGSWQLGSNHGEYPLVLGDETAQHIFARLGFDISPNLQVFAQWVDGANHTLNLCCNSYYPTGIGTLYTSNPYLPAATAAQAAADSVTSFTLGETLRFPESYGTDGGLGVNDYRYEDIYTLGLIGKFNIGKNTYNWNFYGQQGIDTLDFHVGYQSNVTNLSDALQAVRVGSYGPNNSYGLTGYTAANYPNPLGIANGTITCLSNLLPLKNVNETSNCVPYDAFGYVPCNNPSPNQCSAASQAAINYTQGQAYMRQVGIQNILGASITGEPFSDWAGPVSVALDAEYRHESLNGFNDPISTSSSTLNVNGVLQSGFFSQNFFTTYGSEQVTEGAVETVVPLLKDEPLVQELDANAAARATDYSVTGYVTTYKYGLEYTPINDLRFRGVYSEDIRAPNLNNLFGYLSSHGGNATDPFMNNAIAPSYSIIEGNPKLNPEKAHQYELGLVFQPTELPGFNLSVDYYHIKVSGAIASIPSPLAACFSTRIDNSLTGTSPYCSLVVRNANGTLYSVTTYNINEASFLVSGVDYSGDYRKQLTEIVPSWKGALDFHVTATNTMHDKTDSGVAGANEILEATGSGNVPRWAVFGTLTYDLDPWRFAWSERYDSSVLATDTTIVCQTKCPNPIPQGYTTLGVEPREPTYFLATFSVNYKFMQHDQQEAEAFISINNVFNKVPNYNWGLVPDWHVDANYTLNDVIGLYARAGVRVRL